MNAALRSALRHPLAALALALALIVGATTSRAAVITIVNLDAANEGFNDPTPVAPVGGNEGTTIGQQRLNVFQKAAAYWSARLVSSVPVLVGANFDALDCSESSAVLGAAGTIYVVRDFANAPHAATFYPAALGNALAGSDLDPTRRDIGATFSSNLGQPGCLTGYGWYYGFDHNPPGTQLDLYEVVLHEIAHGLGFATYVNLSTGARFNGFNDVFMHNLEDHSTGKTYPQMTDAERVAASINSTNLHWVGTNVVAKSSFLTAGRSPGGHVQMYAPSPQEPGSSVSHFNTTLTPDELMEPFLTDHPNPQLAAEALRDLGWTVLAAQPEIVTNGLAVLAENCGPTNGAIDPGEQVTVSLRLRNEGTTDTTNLVATLLATGGVALPSAAQNYGALVAGGPGVTRNFSFTATGACGANLNLTLQLTDGALGLSNAVFSPRLGGKISFTNSTTITLPNVGNGSPYPATLNVSGVPGVVRGLTVRLFNLTHANPDDIDVLLVGPSGQSVLLMSDAGGATDVSNVTLTFDDDAGALLPDSSVLSSGSFLPSDFSAGDTFAAPAPVGPYGTTLSTFDGSNPNGTWQLFVVDDTTPRAGTIGGWSLSFPLCCSIGGNLAPNISSISNRTVLEQTTLAFNVTASDPESGPLTYALASGAPAGSAINAAGGFTWTPTEAQGPGVYPITVLVSDSGVPPLTNSAGFSVTVTESNRAPQLGVLNSFSIHAGATVSFTASATDPDFPTNLLSFNLAPGAPGGATIGATNGTFSWTPDAGFINSTSTIRVLVTDNGTPPLGASNTFTVAVFPPPAFTQAALSNMVVTLRWSTIAGMAYRLESKTNLVDPDWTTLPGLIIASGPSASATDTPGAAQKFYRVVVQP